MYLPPKEAKFIFALWNRSYKDCSFKKWNATTAKILYKHLVKVEPQSKGDFKYHLSRLDNKYTPWNSIDEFKKATPSIKWRLFKIYTIKELSHGLKDILRAEGYKIIHQEDSHQFLTCKH